MKRRKATFAIERRIGDRWDALDLPEAQNTAQAKRLLKNHEAGDYRVIQLRGEFTVETETLTKATVTQHDICEEGES